MFVWVMEFIKNRGVFITHTVEYSDKDNFYRINSDVSHWDDCYFVHNFNNDYYKHGYW